MSLLAARGCRGYRRILSRSIRLRQIKRIAFMPERRPYSERREDKSNGISREEEDIVNPHKLKDSLYTDLDRKNSEQLDTLMEDVKICIKTEKWFEAERHLKRSYSLLFFDGDVKQMRDVLHCYIVFQEMKKERGIFIGSKDSLLWDLESVCARIFHISPSPENLARLYDARMRLIAVLAADGGLDRKIDLGLIQKFYKSLLRDVEKSTKLGKQIDEGTSTILRQLADKLDSAFEDADKINEKLEGVEKPQEFVGRVASEIKDLSKNTSKFLDKFERFYVLNTMAQNLPIFISLVATLSRSLAQMGYLKTSIECSKTLVTSMVGKAGNQQSNMSTQSMSSWNLKDVREAMGWYLIGLSSIQDGKTKDAAEALEKALELSLKVSLKPSRQVEYYLSLVPSSTGVKDPFSTKVKDPVKEVQEMLLGILKGSSTELALMCLEPGDGRGGKAAETYIRKHLKVVENLMGENHAMTIQAKMDAATALAGSEENLTQEFIDDVLLLKDDELTGEAANILARAGHVMFEMKHFSNAEDLMRKSLSVCEGEISSSSSVDIGNEQIARLCNDLGMVLLSSGELEEAVKALQKSIKIRDKIHGENCKESANAVHNLGQVLMKQRKFTEALPLLMKALKLYGGYVEVEKELNVVKSTMKVEVTNEEKMERTPEEELRAATVVGHIGELYFLSGKLEDAEAYIRHALNAKSCHLEKSNTQLLSEWNNLASVFVAAQKWEDAIETYEKLLQIMTTELEKRRGELAKKKTRNTRETQSQIISRSEMAIAVTRYWLANAYVGAGSLEAAVSEMKVSLDIIQLRLPLEEQAPFWKRHSDILNALGRGQEAEEAKAKATGAHSPDLSPI